MYILKLEASDSVHARLTKICNMRPNMLRKLKNTPDPRWGSSRSRSPDFLAGWREAVPLPIPHSIDAFRVSRSRSSAPSALRAWSSHFSDQIYALSALIWQPIISQQTSIMQLVDILKTQFKYWVGSWRSSQKRLNWFVIRTVTCRNLESQNPIYLINLNFLRNYPLVK